MSIDYAHALSLFGVEASLTKIYLHIEKSGVLLTTSTLPSMNKSRL